MSFKDIFTHKNVLILSTSEGPVALHKAGVQVQRPGIALFVGETPVLGEVRSLKEAASLLKKGKLLLVGQINGKENIEEKKEKILSEIARPLILNILQGLRTIPGAFSLWNDLERNYDFFKEKTNEVLIKPEEIDQISLAFVDYAHTSAILTPGGNLSLFIRKKSEKVLLPPQRVEVFMDGELLAESEDPSELVAITSPEVLTFYRIRKAETTPNWAKKRRVKEIKIEIEGLLPTEREISFYDVFRAERIEAVLDGKKRISLPGLFIVEDPDEPFSDITSWFVYQGNAGILRGVALAVWRAGLEEQGVDPNDFVTEADAVARALNGQVRSSYVRDLLLGLKVVGREEAPEVRKAKIDLEKGKLEVELEPRKGIKIRRSFNIL